MIRFICLVAAVGSVALPAFAQTENMFIFDLLAHGSYKAAYRQLVAKRDVPDWVKDVSRTGAGVASPGKTVTIDGKPYRLDRVCRTSDCKADAITVVFAPGGTRAWALLVENGGAPKTLGDPKPDVAQVLNGGTAAQQ